MMSFVEVLSSVDTNYIQFNLIITESDSWYPGHCSVNLLHRNGHYLVNTLVNVFFTTSVLGILPIVTEKCHDIKQLRYLSLVCVYTRCISDLFLFQYISPE